MRYIDISVNTGIFKIPNIRYSNSQIPEIIGCVLHHFRIFVEKT